MSKTFPDVSSGRVHHWSHTRKTKLATVLCRLHAWGAEGQPGSHLWARAQQWGWVTPQCPDTDLQL